MDRVMDMEPQRSLASTFLRVGAPGEMLVLLNMSHLISSNKSSLNVDSVVKQNRKTTMRTRVMANPSFVYNVVKLSKKMTKRKPLMLRGPNRKKKHRS